MKNNNWKILVVENDDAVAERCLSALNDAGYAVRLTRSTDDALQKMRECPADLVLSEIATSDSPVPGLAQTGLSTSYQPRGKEIDGMRLLANVKEMYPETCVVVISSDENVVAAMEAMRRGASDFLSKPFEERALQRVVSSCLTAANTQRYGSFLSQTSSLLELSKTLSKSTRNLPQRALEVARKAFDADSAILFGFEPAQERIFVIADSGRTSFRFSSPIERNDKSLESIKKRAILFDTNASTGDCHAYLPLCVAEQVRGVLCLARTGGPGFHESNMDLMEMFGAHLAIALESAKIYESAAEQVADLEELVSVCRSLSLSADVETLCERLLKGAGRITSAEISAVMLQTEQGAVLRTMPRLPQDSAEFKAIHGRMQEALSCRSDSAIEAGPVPKDIRSKLISFLNAPLVSGERYFGLLSVFSSKVHAFSADDNARISALAAGASAAAANAETLSRVSVMYQETLEFLGGIVDAKCPDTRGHSTQVRTYATELARALKLTNSQIFLVHDAALLHDVGKICIPDALLSKPVPLTVEESSIVASHAVIGAGMFNGVLHLKELAPVIRHHHEHFDGCGYPSGLRGKDIPLGARIVSVCDVFDALVSHRAYRPAMDFDKARKVLSDRAGSQFDPELVRIFLGLQLEKMTEH